MFNTIREDINNVFKKDPAARSVAEVIICYPGLHALWWHRIAHWCWRHNMRLLARMISQWNRFQTLIEIHPGAIIGRRLFIDHGAAIVIGETAEIGDDVLIYQGVVLGGTSLEKKKRHPTVGNNVVLGTKAVLLGAITIGDGARIGSGSVVVSSVPAGATVVGIPGRVVSPQKKVQELEHNKLPDPVAQAIRTALKGQLRMEERLRQLEKAAGVPSPSEDYSLMEAEVEREFGEGEGITGLMDYGFQPLFRTQTVVVSPHPNPLWY